MDCEPVFYEVVKTLEDDELGLEACAREVGLATYKEMVDLHVACEMVEQVEVLPVLGEPLSGELEEVTS